MFIKPLKRVVALCIAAILCISIAPVTAFAAGTIDLDAEVSLSIKCVYDDKKLSGIPFDIYRIADVSDHNAEFTATEEFSKYPVVLNGLDSEGWKSLAETLTGYIQRDKDTVDSFASGKTNEDGNIVFPQNEMSMHPGLYLVVGTQTTIDNKIYTIQPFLVCLPNRNDAQNTWDYVVNVQPKITGSVIPGADTVSRKVLKVWKDSGYENARPKTITVQLLKDGNIYDTKVLSADTDWSYTWTNLPNQHEWKVVEKEVTGYTTTVSKEGITFVVTNTHENPPPTPDKPSNPSLPQTGTTWYMVPVLICIGLLFLIVGVIIKRKSENQLP